MKTVASLKRKLWPIFSNYIRRRDNFTCITCGAKEKIMHAGHFIGRNGHSNTLFDEMNVNAQCPRCNLWKEGEKPTYALKLIEKYGHEEFKALVKRGNQVKQFRVKELEEMIEEY